MAVLASEEAAHRSCCIGTDKARADTVTLARTEGIGNQVGLRMYAEEEKRWCAAHHPKTLYVTCALAGSSGASPNSKLGSHAQEDASDRCDMHE